MRFLARQPVLAWALCLGVVLLASIFGRPDIPIDETRYVSVAWEMWTDGDWLVLHRNGEPYHHKPPLLFWLINLGWHLFGVNDWWPRCISTLCSLASLILTAAIARRLWPREEGIGARAGWLLLSGAFWLFFSTSVVFDVMLTAFCLLALLALLQVWQGAGRRAWLTFGGALGLGILAKGPVILLVVLPVALLGPWWGGRQASGRSWYGGLALGVALGAVIALAWAVPAALQGGEEYRNAIFWGQTAGRVSGTLAHRQPFWFYLAVLPLLLFPCFFWRRAWSAMIGAVRNRVDPGVRFCLAWMVPALVGFSLAGGKQAHYILPLLPACALLPAIGWNATRDGRRGGLLVLALVIGLLGLVFLLPELSVGKLWLAAYAGAQWRIGGGLLILLGFAVLFLVRGDLAVPWAAAVSAALVCVVLLFVLRPMTPVFDMRPLAERIKALEQQGVPVAHASAYNDQYQFYGRLTRPLEQIARSEIASWLGQHPQGRVVVYLKKAEDAATVHAEFAQPYLDGAVVLVNAEAARRLPGAGGA